MTYPDLVERRPRAGGRSPWGPITEAHELAEGIVEFRAAEGAGVWVSHERRREMPDQLRKVPTYALRAELPHCPGNWYSHDHDSALPMLSWPDIWGGQNTWALLRGEGYRWCDQVVRRAVRMWRGVRRDRAEDVADTWLAGHNGWWLPMRQRSTSSGWTVDYMQIGTGDWAKRVVGDEEYTASQLAVQELPGEPAGTDRRARVS